MGGVFLGGKEMKATCINPECRYSGEIGIRTKTLCYIPHEGRTVITADCPSCGGWSTLVAVDAIRTKIGGLLVAGDRKFVEKLAATVATNQKQ